MSRDDRQFVISIIGIPQDVGAVTVWRVCRGLDEVGRVSRWYEGWQWTTPTADSMDSEPHDQEWTDWEPRSYPTRIAAVLALLMHLEVRGL